MRTSNASARRQTRQIWIGKGVYSIVHAKDGVAIKSIGTDNLESAVREIAILSACDHPKIIKLTRVEFLTTRIKLYMKRYVQDLSMFILSRKISADNAKTLSGTKVSPDEPEVLSNEPEELSKAAADSLPDSGIKIKTIHDISLDILEGLSYLHSVGIIHGDLKPANVLLDENNRAVLCDFGISVLTNERFHTSVVQTCAYRAPEIDTDQYRIKYSTPIDMWSLGCIIIEMITGELLFPGHAEDRTIPICEMLGLVDYEKRGDRMKILNAINRAHMERYIWEKINKDERAYLKKNRLMFIATSCLIPNRHDRLTAEDGVNLLSCAPRSGVGSVPMKTYEHILHADGVFKRILNYRTEECIALAENIYRRVLNAFPDYMIPDELFNEKMFSKGVFTQKTFTEDKLSHEKLSPRGLSRSEIMIKYATIYISECIFQADKMAYYKNTFVVDHVDLKRVVCFVIELLSGNLLSAKKLIAGS